jgi:hypothetical protein
MSRRSNYGRFGDFGQWIPEGNLGEGGNGSVFQVTNRKVKVAVKTLLSHLMKNSGARKRFIDEITLLSRLKGTCSGVVQLIDHSPLDGPPDARLWFSMELCVPVERWLKARPSLTECVRVVAQCADTLATLHSQSIVHRDLKPPNILVRPDGSAVVADLGLADFPDNAGVTKTGKLGPVHYIAPEMRTAKTGEDHRPADVYSLAKTLWVLVTGQTFPIPGHQHRNAEAFTISAYRLEPESRLLDSVIDSATQHDPARRPTMREFADQLNAFLNPVKPADVQSVAAMAEPLRAAMEDINRLTALSRVQEENVHELHVEAGRAIALFSAKMQEANQGIVWGGSVPDEAAMFDIAPQSGRRESTRVSLMRGGSTNISLWCATVVQSVAGSTDKFEAAALLGLSVEGQPSETIGRCHEIVVAKSPLAAGLGARFERVLDRLPEAIGKFCELCRQYPADQLPPKR